MAETPKQNEAPKTGAEAPKLKDRLDELKSVMDKEIKDTKSVLGFLEMFLENSDTKDGVLPTELAADKRQEILGRMSAEQVTNLANVVNDASLKRQLAELARELTPSASDKTPLAGANVFVDKVKSLVSAITDENSNSPFAAQLKNLAPALKKLEMFGISKEVISSSIVSFASQLFASFGRFIPAAAQAAAELEFDNVKRTLKSDETLSPEEKQKRLAALATPQGEKNFKAAVLSWVKKGAKKELKPGSEALLGVQAQPQQAPAAAPVKPAETPALALTSASQDIAVNLGGTEKVGAAFADGTVTFTSGKKKVTVKEVSGKKILSATLSQATETEGGFVTVTLSDNAKLKISMKNVANVPAEKGATLTAQNDSKQDIRFEVSSENQG